MPKSATEPSARERLLDAASELFYAEGIHTVGIDRIIERAGVAKASLYNTYGSKDELVRAYLQGRHERVKARVMAALEQAADPREKILAIFDAQQQTMSQPAYRGCAFVNATAESQPGDVAYDVTGEYREWLRGLLRDFAAEGGAADPDLLASQLLQIYDGTQFSARMDGSASAVETCRTTVQTVLDAALPKRKRPRPA